MALSSPRFLAKSVIDWLLPPRCPVSGELVGANGTVSPPVWSQLNFIQPPYCACCGNPFGHDASSGEGFAEELLCGACITSRPPYTRARAALRYDDLSADIILKFKYADKTLLANIFATWLAQSGAALFHAADFLVPVPLHRRRLIKRRYNQAALLADALSRKTGLPTLPLALRRLRATESQGRKTKLQRHDNVHGAFAVADNFRAAMAGKNVILIDDVMTSGATLSACTDTLLKAGAARVDALTLARICHAE